MPRLAERACTRCLLRTIYAEDPAFRDVATLFTVHNIGYQGIFPPEILPLLMLPWDLFTIARLEFFGQVNLLKGALVMADALTHRQPQVRAGNSDRRVRLWPRRRAAQPRLESHRHPERRGLRRRGIRRADKFIAAHYSAQDLSGKVKCKQDLLDAIWIADVNTEDCP